MYPGREEKRAEIGKKASIIRKRGQKFREKEKMFNRIEEGVPQQSHHVGIRPQQKGCEF